MQLEKRREEGQARQYTWSATGADPRKGGGKFDDPHHSSRIRACQEFEDTQNGLLSDAKNIFIMGFANWNIKMVYTTSSHTVLF